MLILIRYIFRELLLSFVALFLLITIFIYLVYLFQSYRQFQSLGAEIFLKYCPILLLYVLPYTTEMALVSATTLCYGRFSSDNEIDAMRVNGVYIGWVLMPAAVLGAVLSVVVGYLNHELLPYSMYEQRKMQKEAMLYLFKSPPPGAQTISIGAVTLSYSDFIDGKFRNFDAYTFNEDGRMSVRFSGREAVIDMDGAQPILKMPTATVKYTKDGHEYELTANNIAEPLPVKQAPDQKRPKYASTSELPQYFHGERRYEALTEYHLRYARSVYPLLFAIMAALVGVFVRRSSKLAGLGASLPVVVLYFVLSIAFEGLSVEGKMKATLAAYIPVAVVVLIDMGLFWKVRK